MKYCCILIALIYILQREVSADFCSFNSTIQPLPSSWFYATVGQVRSCFQNISTDSTVINNTMTQLFNSLDFYSFLSIVRQSNDPYNTNVQFRNELLNIMNQTNRNLFANDYDFHMSVVSVFRKLNDFHTQYNAPSGYAEFNLLLPFVFEYLPLTKQIKIKLGIQLYSLVTGNNVSKNYNDKIVTKIDGINALDFMKQFAQTQSLISKDLIVKLNSVFREEFWLRNLADYPLPASNNISITIIDNGEVTLTLPYVVIITRKFDNQTSLESENIFTGPEVFDKKKVSNFITTFENLDWYQMRNNNTFQFITSGNKTYYYIHKPTQTAVIKLSSFEENNADDIKRIFSMASGKTLLIDLLGNHGGHSCLAYALLNFLVPEYGNLSTLYEPMDGRLTEPLKLFSTTFSFFPNSILNLENGTSFTDMAWINTGINYTRGGTTDEYSIKWSINCDGDIFGGGSFWMRNSTNASRFPKIYVLTDGTCGSACSLFLSKLRYGSNFKKAFGIGGGYDGNELFESSSYAGGGAFKWNDIVNYYGMVAGNSSTINHLPTSAFLNLNVYEIYIRKLSGNYPREFLKQPIDIRLNDSDYVNIQKALEAIINYDNRTSQPFSTGSTFSKMMASYLIVVGLFFKVFFSVL